MITQLDTPVPVSTPYGVVNATHQAWGAFIAPWNEPPVKSYRMLGVMVDGKFQSFPGSEEYADIAGDDYRALVASSDSGKLADAFRNTDVSEMHRVIVARRTAEAEARREPVLETVAR